MPTRYLVFFENAKWPRGVSSGVEGSPCPTGWLPREPTIGCWWFHFSLFDEERPKAPALTQDLIIGSLGFFHVLVEVKEYLLTVLDRRGVSFVLKPQQGPSHKAFLLIGAVLASKQGPNAYGPFVVPAGPGDDGPWDSPLAIVLLMIHCMSHSNRPREGQGKPVGSFLQTIKRMRAVRVMIPPCCSSDCCVSETKAKPRTS